MAHQNLTFLIKITCIIMTLVVVFYQITLTNEINLAHAYVLNNRSLPDFNFAAAGDWDCNSNSKNTLNKIIDKNPELVLGLGDYSYEDKADCWLQLVEPVDHKMKITIGNHDHIYSLVNGSFYLSPSLLQEYMTHFNLSKQYYSFNYQNVHFIAMSTEVPFDSNSEQYKFVMSDLVNSSSDPNNSWIIVFYHRLAYTSPALMGSIPKFRDTYHPVFEKYNVDIVLQGHSHNYQRSFPISYNSSTPTKPSITDTAKFSYYSPKGQIFATVGTGGAPDIHRFSAPQTRFTAVQFNAFGFLNIDVLHNGTMLEGKFYENNGTIKDHFTIVKSNKDNKQIDSSSSSLSSSSLSSSEPRLMKGYEDKFRIDTVVKGLRSPTDIAFLGPGDYLVLEKNKGTVIRIVNGQELAHPLLDTSVSNNIERGLLGVAVSNVENGTKYIYLYYTEAKHAGQDICPESNHCDGGIEPIGNRLYRYELANDGSKLINPELLLEVPAIPGPEHNGGKMIIDDSRIFIIVGDVMNEGFRTQNYYNGKEPNGTGGILKIELNDNTSNKGILGSKYPLNLYYAYGIRNGFGLDFDPVTGNLWDTENGPEFGDEINLVEPGFNSGWKDIQGIWNHKGGKAQKGPLNLDGLEDFNGKGNYSEPEFIWENTVGPTGIKFFSSDKMGTEYRDSLFVGDVHNGNLYHFNLNDDRTSLLLDGMLADRVANSPNELEKAIFAEGFGGITDLEVGPDGYLYLLSIGHGAIYRILPQ